MCRCLVIKVGSQIVLDPVIKECAFMKAIKILTHPYSLIISFFMIIISGEHIGGIYLLYLLLALPTGAIHTILAYGGVGLLLLNHHKYGNKNTYLKKLILNLGGLSFLFLSIYFFFINDKERYNYGTFHQTVPLITLVTFFIVAICFLLGNLKRK